MLLPLSAIILHNLPITVNGPSVTMNLVYIDDVVNEMIQALLGKENRSGDFCEVPVVHTITLGEIVDLITLLSRAETSCRPDMSDEFTRSYTAHLSCRLTSLLTNSMIKDNRIFTVIKTLDRGRYL